MTYTRVSIVRSKCGVSLGKWRNAHSYQCFVMQSLNKPSRIFSITYYLLNFSPSIHFFSLSIFHLPHLIFFIQISPNRWIRKFCKKNVSSFRFHLENWMKNLLNHRKNLNSNETMKMDICRSSELSELLAEEWCQLHKIFWRVQKRRRMTTIEKGGRKLRAGPDTVVGGERSKGGMRGERRYNTKCRWKTERDGTKGKANKR